MALNVRAVVIGIDTYANQPLTSAVNDARAFADRLIELGLVDAEGVVLLEDEQATR